MRKVLVPAKPGLLAVVVGVGEVIIAEIFKFALIRATAAHRKWSLYQNGIYNVQAKWQRYTKWVILGWLFVLVASTIIVELSIDATKVRSGKRVQTLCAAVRQPNMFQNGDGGRDYELKDNTGYLFSAGCVQRNSLIGSPLLDKGTTKTQCEDQPTQNSRPRPIKPYMQRFSPRTKSTIPRRYLQRISHMFSSSSQILDSQIV